MNRANTAVTTANGRLFDLYSPDPVTVDLAEVAEGLAKERRWAGQTPGVFYSVAQHSAMVGALAAELSKGDARAWAYGLLHDAHECWTGDLATPAKNALRQHGGGDAWDRMTASLDRSIHIACGLEWPLNSETAGIIKDADAAALQIEYRDLMPGMPAEWLPTPSARAAGCMKIKRIKAYPWPRAMEHWEICLTQAASSAGLQGPAIAAMTDRREMAF